MHPSRRILAVLAAAAVAAGLGSGPATGPAPSGYPEEIDAWHARRVDRLRSDTGWLTVAGLYWLDEGDNTFGTDPENDVVFPAGTAPARAGVFVHARGTTRVRAHAGTLLACRGRPVQEMLLRSDAEDTTDVVELGHLRFFVIRRGDRWAIRLRDLHSPMRAAFHGIERYPVDPSYRVEARFEAYDPPRLLPIPTILGTVDSMRAPGALVFALHGQELRLDAVQEDPRDESLFLIFSDTTNGEETYPAGRFLYTDLPHDGKVVVDFNKAYNPPCAFTPYATCPLPPRQNELAVAVRAGEKNYGDH